jgi:anti-sigma28 factor (negative regulator of flagellin synthesis)
VAAQDRFSQSSQVDAATLSAAASTFAQALSGGDVRSEKVAGLQQSILAGTYSVPVSDVAAKVLNALLQ